MNENVAFYSGDWPVYQEDIVALAPVMAARHKPKLSQRLIGALDDDVRRVLGLVAGDCTRIKALTRGEIIDFFKEIDEHLAKAA